MSTRKDPFIFLKQQPPLFLAYPIPSLFLHAKKYPLITYEKALLGQATGGKFPSVTFIERKQMSTKTSIKRIALVAAAALTLGGFSAVSANAAAPVVSGTAPTVAATATEGGGTGVSMTATPATKTYQAINLTAGTADSYYTITTSAGGTVFYGTDANNNLSGSGSTYIWSQGIGAIGTGSGGSWSTHNVLAFSAYSEVAGTQTITIKGNVSAAVTAKITWGGTPTVSATYSTAKINKAGGAEAYTSDEVVLVGSTLNTIAGTIKVVVYGSNNAAFASGTATVAASVSGAGLVLVDANTGTTETGTARSSSAAANTAYVHVSADGSSGVGTITITLTDPNTGASVVLGTKTVTFYGSKPASMKVATNATNARSAAGSWTGSTATSTDASGAFSATVLDSNGNPVAGLSETPGSSSSQGFYIVSDNTACIPSTINAIGSGDGASLHAAMGTYNFGILSAANSLSGCSANVTLHYYHSSTLDIAGTPIKFTTGDGKISAITLTTDAASYTPGQKVTATLTAKDASGNPVADGDYGVFYDNNQPVAKEALTPFAISASTTTAPFGIVGDGSAYALYTFANGVSTDTFYAPYTDGTVTMSAKLAKANTGFGSNGSGVTTALLGTAVSASFDVATGTNGTSALALDAANAATDAANNAYDEAQNATQAASDALAAVTALSAQVSALIATVKSLAAMVAKIKAKVKA